jgi:hypothetical protein
MHEARRWHQSCIASAAARKTQGMCMVCIRINLLFIHFVCARTNCFVASLVITSAEIVSQTSDVKNQCKSEIRRLGKAQNRFVSGYQQQHFERLSAYVGLIVFLHGCQNSTCHAQISTEVQLETVYYVQPSEFVNCPGIYSSLHLRIRFFTVTLLTLKYYVCMHV